jgi:hypothetical protein
MELTYIIILKNLNSLEQTINIMHNSSLKKNLFIVHN